MTAPALSTRMVNKRFGQLVVARDISISIPRGERYALIGPNGAGKTTLINLMTGMLRPDQRAYSARRRRHHPSQARRAGEAWACAHVPDQHAVPQSHRARNGDACDLRAQRRRRDLVEGAAVLSRRCRRSLRDPEVAQARRSCLSHDARACLRPATAAGNRAGARDRAGGAAAGRTGGRSAPGRKLRIVHGDRRALEGHHGAVHRARHERGVRLPAASS